MNLKQVRLKKVGDSFDNKINIAIKNKQVFSAGDISDFTSSFEILNPDHVICNLDKKVNFEIELTIEKGRGYVSADDNKPAEQIYGLLHAEICTPAFFI